MKYILLIGLLFLSISCSQNTFKKLDKLSGNKNSLSLDGCLDMCLRESGIIERYMVNPIENYSECTCGSKFK